MFWYLNLYLNFICQYIKGLLQSKVNFLIGFIGFLVGQITSLFFLSVVFNNIHSLNGWSFNEMLFIYGFSQIPKGLDHFFTDNIWNLSARIVVKGEFDKYLLRPINPLFHLISETLQPDAFGELIVGCTIIIYSCTKMHLSFNIFNFITFLLIVFFGAIIYFSIKLFVASLSFWIKKSLSILKIIYSFSDFAKYPLSIYPKWINFLITILFPFAFTACIPATAFLGKSNLLQITLYTLISAFISWKISYFAWNVGINHYESSGN